MVLALILILVVVLVCHVLFHLTSSEHLNKSLGGEAQELGVRRHIGVGDGVVVRGRGLRVVGDIVLVVVFAWDLVLVAP